MIPLVHAVVGLGMVVIVPLGLTLLTHPVRIGPELGLDPQLVIAQIAASTTSPFEPE